MRDYFKQTIMNEKLIQQLANGKAAIEFIEGRDKLEDLNKVLNYTFPGDNYSIVDADGIYYFKPFNYLQKWSFSATDKPLDKTIYPLSAFLEQKVIGYIIKPDFEEYARLLKLQFEFPVNSEAEKIATKAKIINEWFDKIFEDAKEAKEVVNETELALRRHEVAYDMSLGIITKVIPVKDAMELINKYSTK